VLLLLLLLLIKRNNLYHILPRTPVNKRHLHVGRLAAHHT
jgi:hypothetical protein